MRCQFSTAADQRMMWVGLIGPLVRAASCWPGATSSKKSVIASPPDQRLTIDQQGLAGFGAEAGLDDHKEQVSALALLERHLDVFRLGDGALADPQAAEELDLIAAVQ